MRTCSRNIVVAIVILITVPRVGVAVELYTGPMIDAYSHLGASFDWDLMVHVMNLNNVSRQIVMARYYPGPAGSADRPGNEELALELASKCPGRFFPIVGMQRPELTGANKWLNPDAAVETILNSPNGRRCPCSPLRSRPTSGTLQAPQGLRGNRSLRGHTQGRSGWPLTRSVLAPHDKDR
jgi:hypothetical protein